MELLYSLSGKTLLIYTKTLQSSGQQPKKGLWSKWSISEAPPPCGSFSFNKILIYPNLTIFGSDHFTTSHILRSCKILPAASIPMKHCATKSKITSPQYFIFVCYDARSLLEVCWLISLVNCDWVYQNRHYKPFANCLPHFMTWFDFGFTGDVITIC